MRRCLVIASAILILGTGCVSDGSTVYLSGHHAGTAQPTILIDGLEGITWSNALPLPVTTTDFSLLVIHDNGCVIESISWSEVGSANALEFSDRTVLGPVVTLTQSGTYQAMATVRYRTPLGIQRVATCSVYLAYPPYALG